MERVITVGVQLAKVSTAEANASLEELTRLVETAGGTVIDTLSQNRDRPDPAFFIGKGKAEELSRLVQRHGVRTIVLNEPLKPGQQQNLEEVTQAKVVDRTRLILDIFAQRARTREGKLQVELAQLSYLLPRLTERFGRFEQQTGGIGTRGPGERKLEVDKRRLRDRMTSVKKDLEHVRRQRDQQRAVRRSVPIPQVAIMGYTNAGKSTLLNALVAMYGGSSKTKDPQVYADDKLFATLDPTTRRIRLPSGRFVLFTDTVGFIRKLPTELVAAFRATLEETAGANLLVHVIDASGADWEDQAHTVLEIVRELHMEKLPVLTAYNKMDRLSPSQIERFSAEEGIVLSASQKIGLKEFLERVEEALVRDTRQ